MDERTPAGEKRRIEFVRIGLTARGNAGSLKLRASILPCVVKLSGIVLKFTGYAARSVFYAIFQPKTT